MTHSMTAFSRIETELQGVQIVWEIRTVNHRYLDINLRLPDALRYLDTDARKRISNKINRGRVDAQLKVESASQANDAEGIDSEALATLASLIKKVEKALPQAQPARSTDILGWPGVIKSHQIDNDSLAQQAMESLGSALSELSDNRAREGKRLGEILSEKVRLCETIAHKLHHSIHDIQQAARERMENKIKEFAENLDPERMAQETAILLTKSDVSEELDRLFTHLTETARLLDAKQPVGRRLDFLMQELNREANTLGSKSMDEKMTNASIELKVLIDQMREQIQNIE